MHCHLTPLDKEPITKAARYNTKADIQLHLPAAHAALFEQHLKFFRLSKEPNNSPCNHAAWTTNCHASHYVTQHFLMNLSIGQSPQMLA
jgi:hypothetical protein